MSGFILFSGLLAVATAKDLKVTLKLNDFNCAAGCFDALALRKYGDIAPTAGYYDGYCGSILFATSLASCVDKYCRAREVEAGWEYYTQNCAEYGKGQSLLPLAEIRKLANNTEIIDTRVPDGTMVNSTIIPSKDAFGDGIHTENAWNQAMNFHHAFGWSMYILFGATVLGAMVGRGFEKMKRRNGAAVCLGGRTWYQKHIGTPALHAEAWQVFSLPTRLQAIIITAYVIINVIFCVANYDLFSGNMYWADTRTQLARYVADRTSIICFYNMPLLFLLGGRNNVFLWLTGWSYSTASLLHRWIAFVATLQAIVHSACYTWLEKGYIATEWKERYWRSGVFATIIMSIIIVCSFRPIRARFYEVFLLLHILMAVTCLVLLFYHVEIFEGQYDPWMWACVGVWCLDRFIRLARMVILSFRAFGPGGINTRASLTYKQSGMIRLSVTPSVAISSKPGHYYYIYTPWSLTPWENHPMTLASWRGGQLQFLIGPKTGATRRLQQRLEKKNGADDIRILLEGPYGHSHNLQHIDRILLVAGGSGITAIMPYFAKYGDRCSIVWTVSHEDYATDVLRNELAGGEVQVYINREDAEASSSPVPSDKERESSHQVSHARPSMAAVVSKATNDLIGGERLAILTCGPGAMMDDTRAAVVAGYGRFLADQIEYFEEAFGW